MVKEKKWLAEAVFLETSHPAADTTVYIFLAQTLASTTQSFCRGVDRDNRCQTPNNPLLFLTVVFIAVNILIRKNYEQFISNH